MLPFRMEEGKEKIEIWKIPLETMTLSKVIKGLAVGSSRCIFN